MTNPPAALWAGIPGIMILVGAGYVDQPASGIMVGVGGILLLVAVVVLCLWARDVWVDQQARLMDARDRETARMREIRGLGKEQLDFLYRSGTVGIAHGLDGEKYLYGTSVPLWFAADFLSKCHNRALYPIRNYSEGTDGRRWAGEITSALVGAGLAYEAAGNLSATLAEGVTPEIIAGRLELKISRSTTPLPQVNGAGEPENGS